MYAFNLSMLRELNKRLNNDDQNTFELLLIEFLTLWLQIKNPSLPNNESCNTDAELSHGVCCNSSVSR